MSSALNKQEGGSHYKQFVIQPVEYCHKNQKFIGPSEASVIKYTSRHKFKNHSEDIKKAIHMLQFILEFDYGILSNIEYSDSHLDGPEEVEND